MKRQVYASREFLFVFVGAVGVLFACAGLYLAWNVEERGGDVASEASIAPKVARGEQEGGIEQSVDSEEVFILPEGIEYPVEDPMEKYAQDSYYIQIVPEYVEQAAKYKAILEQETLEESLRNLSDVDWFYEWRVPAEALRAEVPLDENHGVVELKRIFENRRFRRLLLEMKGLDRNQVTRLVRDEVNVTFDLYRKTFWERWDSIESRAQSLPPNSLKRMSPTVQTGSNSDGTPTIEGLRLELLALTLLSTNLDLPISEVGVDKIINEALQQREHFYQVAQEVGQRSAISMLARLGLYHRSILGGALQSQNEEREDFPEFQFRRGTIKREAELELFNKAAEQSPVWIVDKRGGHRATVFSNNRQGVMEDLTHGVIEIRILDPFNITEEQFNAIVEQTAWQEK
jgi:hypothetical protein